MIGIEMIFNFTFRSLESLKEMYLHRENEIDNISHERITLQSDFEKRKINVPGLADRFQFYQDLRGYVTDLVECLDEKVGFIKSICARFKRHNYLFYCL